MTEKELNKEEESDMDEMKSFKEVKENKVTLEIENNNLNAINDFILRNTGLKGLPYVVEILNSVKK